MAQRRRLITSNTWHSCSNCSNYPQSGYTTTGTGGDQCDECMAKKARGDCS